MKFDFSLQSLFPSKIFDAFGSFRIDLSVELENGNIMVLREQLSSSNYHTSELQLEFWNAVTKTYLSTIPLGGIGGETKYLVRNGNILIGEDKLVLYDTQTAICLREVMSWHTDLSLCCEFLDNQILVGKEDSLLHQICYGILDLQLSTISMMPSKLHRRTH